MDNTQGLVVVGSVAFDTIEARGVRKEMVLGGSGSFFCTAASYFTPVKRPLYLTGMAVSVAYQQHGLGRLALEDARSVARRWPAAAIRLDAYDADAGAGRFYAKCGFRECGRIVYKGNPLVYYELLFAQESTA